MGCPLGSWDALWDALWDHGMPFGVGALLTDVLLEVDEAVAVLIDVLHRLLWERSGADVGRPTDREGMCGVGGPEEGRPMGTAGTVGKGTLWELGANGNWGGGL